MFKQIKNYSFISKIYFKPMKALTISILMASCILHLSPALDAQTVSTYLTGAGLNGPDGFAMDTAQNLYVANWGGGNGTTVLKISPDALVSIFDSTSTAPDGLVFDDSCNLYISNYGAGTISKVNPLGLKTVFVSGLVNPSALAFNSYGYLFASNFSNGKVSKISPDGDISEFASGFSGPLGLVFGSLDNLYVSNYLTGVVHKVTPDGEKAVFATVPNGNTSKTQYLAIGKSGNLYLPSYGHNVIYKISPEGLVESFAGTGSPGGTDGPVAQASFNGPNSIVFTKNGDLLVSEYNANRIRKISGVEPNASSIDQEIKDPIAVLYQNQPNPVTDITAITYYLAKRAKVLLEIHDMPGNLVKVVDNQYKDAGKHVLFFDTNELSPGTYFYSLSVEGFKYCKKFIVF